MEDGGAVGANFRPEGCVAEAVAENKGVSGDESSIQGAHGGGGVVEGHALGGLTEALGAVWGRLPTV